MQLDLETVLTVMARSYHFNFTVIEPPFCGLENFDKGLRRSLKPDFDFREFGARLLEKMPVQAFVVTRDELNCTYVLLRLPQLGEKVYVFGPVIQAVMMDETGRQIHERFGSKALQRFQEIYQSIHIAYDRSGETFLQELHAAAFRHVELKREEVPGFLPMPLFPCAESLFPTAPESSAETAQLEERFRLETQMVNAIIAGDSQRAIHVLDQLTHQAVPTVRDDPRRNPKYLAFEASAICRYAIAASQQVHPSYVQRIHDSYVRKLSAVTSIREIDRLTAQMVTSYCDCVQNNSLERYSPLIRRVINHIHLHLDGTLNLRSLALLCNVNPSYLSKLFREETGVTLTEFVNCYRVERSIPLLRFTQMTIAQVSESVGFLDENYYARIFKKHMGLSPKAYRQQNKV